MLIPVPLALHPSINASCGRLHYLLRARHNKCLAIPSSRDAQFRSSHCYLLSLFGVPAQSIAPRSRSGVLAPFWLPSPLIVVPFALNHVATKLIASHPMRWVSRLSLIRLMFVGDLIPAVRWRFWPPLVLSDLLPDSLVLAIVAYFM